jgi:hypothetical protein
MNEPLTPSNANRLAIGLARYRGIPYAEAAQILRSLSLRIVANTTACSRVAGQAAVLTAINTAHRAFLGGVEFIVPEAVPLLLPIPGVKSLREAIALTGCTPVSLAKQTHTVFIGNPSGDNPWDDVLVHCDGWRGGSSDLGAPAQFEIGDADDFALGGIFGGASAVHRCFVRATGMPANCLNAPCGFSLWAPGSEWLKPEGQRHLFNIPIHFWMLGLGHLGQGFLWNLAILPHSSREDVLFLLNDFDSIEETNLGSGLLCTRTSVGQKKARYCAAWLEKFGFATTVCERPFGPDTKRTGKEPAIAFCGFDVHV